MSWYKSQLQLYKVFLPSLLMSVLLQVLMDVYFLSSQKTRPSLFGTPIIIPRDENTTCQDLYHFVWVQVARLVSPLPPSEQRTTNHAQDWYARSSRRSHTSYVRDGGMLSFQNFVWFLYLQLNFSVHNLLQDHHIQATHSLTDQSSLSGLSHLSLALIVWL